MSLKSNLNKQGWNDSMHIFFSPKLSLEGRNMFPHLVDSISYPRDQNFLTVFKKPIVNIYEKISSRRDRKAVFVEGEPKELEKRNQTTNPKKRNISAEMEVELIKNYQEAFSQITQLTKVQPKKGSSSNKLTQNKDKIDPDDCLYFYLGPGNNAELVAAVLRRRQKWTQTSSSLFHFRWEQTRAKHCSNSIQRQLFNHLPMHEAISDKVGLTRNLRAYCLKQQIEMFREIPACFELNFGNPEVCENQIKKFIDFYCACLNRGKGAGSDYESTNASEEKTHHMLDSPKKITKKDSPLKHSKNFRSHKKESPSPVTNDIRSQEVKQIHRSLILKLKPYHTFVDMSALKKESPFVTPIQLEVYGESGLWILKPADMNRGRGIHLFRRVEDLGDLLRGELARNEKASFIVQKYIEKPLLIKGRKFDIRMYAMVTQSKQVYFFREGYIRTSSMLFDLTNSSHYAHLTNNAIQKHSKTYGEFEEGNILPLCYLWREMGLEREQLMEQMRRKVRMAMQAGFPEMFKCEKGSTSAKAKQFEIFGFDFMIDESKHFWIIEVNTNPCLELSCSWLAQIIPRMLNDAFKLTLDRVFPKGRELLSKAADSLSVEGYEDGANMWEYMDLKAEIAMTESCHLPS